MNFAILPPFPLPSDIPSPGLCFIHSILLLGSFSHNFYLLLLLFTLVLLRWFSLSNCCLFKTTIILLIINFFIVFVAIFIFLLASPGYPACLMRDIWYNFSSPSLYCLSFMGLFHILCLPSSCTFPLQWPRLFFLSNCQACSFLLVISLSRH